MRAILIGLTVSALATAACAASAPSASVSRDGRHAISGTVVAWPDARTVTLAHDAIEHVMPAMVMDLATDAAPELLVGTRIRGTLVVTDAGSLLTGVEIVPARAAASAARAPGVAAPPGSLVPDVLLRLHTNDIVSLSRYRGHVLLVTFMYTRCPLPEFCPRLMHNFSEFSRAISADPALASTVQLLSVSIDPEFDTAEVLRVYGEAFAGVSAAVSTNSAAQSAPVAWHLATGTPDDVRALAGFVGLQYEPESSTIRHSMDTAIIGADGRLVKRFPGMTWDPDQALSIVAREAGRAAGSIRDN